jgi:hypothetical protein
VSRATIPRLEFAVLLAMVATAPIRVRADVGVVSRMAPGPSRAAQSAASTLAPSLAARAQGRTIQVAGHAVSASEYLAKTPHNTSVTLRSGRATTLGALLDSYAKLDGTLKQHGSSLDRISKTSWAGGGAQPALAGAPAPSSIDYPAGDHNRAQRIARHDQSGWSIAPYSDFAVQGSDPATADSSQCTISWDAGIKLYGTTIGVVKVVGSATTASTTGPKVSLQIYVLGKSEFVGDFGMDGDPPFEKAISTSQLPGGEPSADLDIIPNVLKVHAVAGGSAYVKLDTRGDGGAVELAGTDAGAGKDVGFFCRARITPTLYTEAHMRADSDIGPTIAGLPALTVSAHGSLVPIEIEFPTAVTLAIHDTPPKIGFGFQWKLHVRLMTGKLHFTWQLPDVCVGGNCVVADGLGVNTSGEILSWNQTNPPLDTTIANQDPGLGTETLAPR